MFCLEGCQNNIHSRGKGLTMETETPVRNKFCFVGYYVMRLHLRHKNSLSLILIKGFDLSQPTSKKGLILKHLDFWVHVWKCFHWMLDCRISEAHLIQISEHNYLTKKPHKMALMNHLLHEGNLKFALVADESKKVQCICSLLISLSDLGLC